MGLAQAVAGAIGGVISDQWLDAIVAIDMGEGIVFARGHQARRHNAGGDIITDSSKIIVYDNQAMLITDSGRIMDFSTDPGAYTFSSAITSSLLNGSFEGILRGTWERFKFGGAPSGQQKAFFVNLQEIKGIKFSTPNAIQYFDNFYNAKLFLRAHSTHSIRIVNPLKFYAEVVPRDAERVHVDDIKNQYQVEFLEAFSVALNKMSVDGIRVSQVQSHMGELSKHMRNALDEEWEAMRGIEIQAVGIASTSYDEQSRKLIDMRNQDAILQDPPIREGYVQSAIAAGIQNAGPNPAGAGSAMLGVGMGMQAGGGFIQAASAPNQAQVAAHPQVQGMSGTGSTTGDDTGATNSPGARSCSNCGTQFGQPKPNFRPQCGQPIA